jgi:hypothetical protein
VLSNCIQSEHIKVTSDPVDGDDVINKDYLDTRSMVFNGTGGIIISPTTVFLGGSTTISINTLATGMNLIGTGGITVSPTTLYLGGSTTISINTLATGMNLIGTGGITVSPTTLYLGGSATISFTTSGGSPTFGNIFKTISYATVAALPYTLTANELLSSYIIVNLNGTGNLTLPSISDIVSAIGYYQTNMAFNFSILKNGTNHVHILYGTGMSSPVTINLDVNADHVTNLILVITSSTTGIILPLGSDHSI